MEPKRAVAKLAAMRLFTLLAGGCLFAGMKATAQEAIRPAPPTLVAPATATLAPDADGFLRRWLVLEPIPVNGQLSDSAVRATIDQFRLPGEVGKLPADNDSIPIGGETRRWHALDSRNYNLNLFHFARGLGQPTSNVLFWVTTVVDAPRALDNVRLAIGSNAASIWWVNEVEVIAIYNDRQTVIDDGVSPRLALRQGRNTIRAAIINAGGATDFTARIVDEHYQPVTALVLRLDQARR
jgi:hypothetical protein